jgi:multidrug efflux pump subunit AcrA (membrane-fusion protein)
MLAPFNGVVLDRMLHPGDLAEAGSGRKPVLKVAQIDPLKVEIVVPGSLFGKIRPGVRAVVTPRGMSDKHAATVSAVDKVVDAASGTFIVRLDLANPNQTLPGGVRCSAEIDGVSPPSGVARSAKPAL